MVRKRFMLVAGEPSGDLLGSELVRAIRRTLPEFEETDSSDRQPLATALEPTFFGAGGPRMAEAGVDLAIDLTSHAVVGLFEVLRELLKFRRFLNQLLRLARERQPHVIVCIDFSGFNLRLLQAVHRTVRANQGTFWNWSPKLVQFVSPQVWASRPGRAQTLADNADLLLSILPFEKEWYARCAPGFPVEFVGHPIVDRHAAIPFALPPGGALRHPERPLVVLLPGSRTAELHRHLPVLIQAADRIRAARSVQFHLVLPHADLAAMARQALAASSVPMEVRVGGLSESLAQADLALACTGTVTLECLWFAVPTVAIYITSWGTYQIAKRVASVRWLAMPNLIAQELLYPEFLQETATGETVAREGLDLLSNLPRRAQLQSKLRTLATSLGSAGAAERAARIIGRLAMQPSAGCDLRAFLFPSSAKR